MYSTIPTRIGLSVVGFILFVVLGAAAGDWTERFQQAEEAFNSRRQESCIPLFETLVADLEKESAGRDLSRSETDIMQRSLDFLGQAYFNRNDPENTQNAYLRLIAINPGYRLDSDTVSPKIVELVMRLKEESIGYLTIRINSTDATVKVDGRKRSLSALESIPLVRGNHVVEVSLPGYLTERKSIHTQPGALQELTIDLKTDPSAMQSLKDGLLSLRAMELSDAKTELEKGLTAAPQDAKAHAALVETLLLLGREEEAEEAAKAALALAAVANTTEEANRIRAIREEAALNTEAALSSYREMYDRASGSFEAGFRLATALVRAGNGKDALGLANRLQPSDDIDDARTNWIRAQAYELLSDERRQLNAALQTAESARKAGSKLLGVRARLLEARARFRLGEYSSARSSIEGVGLLSASNGDRLTVGLAGLAKGDLLMALKDHTGAQRQYEAATRILREIGNRSTTGPALYKLGVLLQETRDPMRAKNSFESAIPLLRKTGPPGTLADALLRSGETLIQTNEKGSAKEHLEEALSLFREAGDKGGEARTVAALATLLEGPSAIQKLEEAAAILRQSGDKTSLAQTLTRLAEMQAESGNAPLAGKLYAEALMLFRETDDRKGAARTSYRLGMLTEKQQDRGKAAWHYRDAMILFRETGDQKTADRIQKHLDEMFVEEKSQLTLLLQTGFGMLNQGNYAGAEEAYRRALDLARYIGDRNGEAETLNRLGFLLFGKKENEEANESWTRALTIAREIGDKQIQALSLFNLAMLNHQMGNDSQAIRFYEESTALYLEMGQPPRRRPW